MSKIQLQEFIESYTKMAKELYDTRVYERYSENPQDIYSANLEQLELSELEYLVESTCANDMVDIVMDEEKEILDARYIQDSSLFDKLSEVEKVETLCNLKRRKMDILKYDIRKSHMRKNKHIKKQNQQHFKVEKKQVEHLINKAIKPKKENLFSEMIELFIEEQNISRAWIEKTKDKNKSALLTALKIIEDKDISDYERKNFIHLREILMKLPPNISKYSTFKNMTYIEIANKSHEKVLSTVTINKIILTVSDFFNWAVLNKYCEINLAVSLKIKTTIRNVEKKKPFEDSDIIAIKNNLYQDMNKLLDTNVERVWIPLIGFFNAMRLEEIAQLHINDVYEDDEGIWVFDLNSKNEHINNIAKQIKNTPSHSIMHPFFRECSKFCVSLI